MKGMRSGSLAAPDQEVLIVEHHHIPTFDGDPLTIPGGREHIDVIEVDQSFLFLEMLEGGMIPEDETGEEVFPVAGFLGCFSDDNVVIDYHGNIPGKDEVGNRIKINVVCI